MSDRPEHRGQAGLTLIEVLVATVIAILIGVPMLSWVTTTVRSTATVTDQLGRSNQTGLLNAYFPRDVASARSVESADAAATLGDCGAGPAAGGRVALNLITAGSTPRRVTYTEAPGSAGTGTSLWRRACALEPGAQVESVELFRNVAAGSTAATCPGGPDDACGAGVTQVQLVTRPELTSQVVTVRATRRATDDSGGADETTGPGTRPPLAKAFAAPFKGYRSTTFTLDARSSVNQRSADPLTATWTLPEGAACAPVGGDELLQECAVSQVGSATFVVAVGDGRSVGTAAVTVEVLNRSPQAGTPTAAPGAVTVGETVELRAVGATDPEGDPLTYEWDLGEGIAPVSGPEATATIPADLPSSLLGERQVRLVVSDDRGGRDAAFVTFIVVPSSGPELPLSAISPTPYFAGGNPVPLVGGVGASPLVVSLRTRPDAGLVDPTVELVPFGGSSPVGACAGTTPSCENLAFGTPDVGSYEVVVRENVGGQRVERERTPFRVGRYPTPVLRVIATGGTVPKVVTFTAEASSDDGAIVSWRWDFGCGNPTCTSTDVAPVHTFTVPGVYTVRLTVTDQDGLSSEQATSITVGPS